MDYSNILNINKEEVIKEVINKTKSELEGLTKERTCKSKWAKESKIN